MLPYLIGIIEAMIYIAYIIYSIYIPVKTYTTKKKLKHKHNIIKNPSNQFFDFMSRAVLILSLPSIILMFTLAQEDDVIGVIIYFIIFLILMITGIKMLLSIRGDFYFDENGIHFVRSEKLTIYYTDIERAEWYDGSFSEGIQSIVKLRVKGKHIKVFNITKNQYEKYVSVKNIHSLKHDIKLSKSKKAFDFIFFTIFIIAFLAFFALYIYSTKKGGSALNALLSKVNIEIYENAEMSHYLMNGRSLTAVEYSVWIKVLIFEISTLSLYALTFLCYVINFIWSEKIQHNSYEK